ncbi:MAG: LPS export ABC transporter ATP-binding protein [Candidatus Omnitrophica bacterium]|nr:LPS export ABC transporter ATP-binding protein [Candidatus Omnitrophota bacterium]MCM8810865.1 LPS export ABC transporter ATP-binding protein [Candidatus Omnitrophota bacterium]MCM8833288.1 LPS export ABC transporter ATP-binding protein [Candidatus Omnitrophota bacterium]
MLEIKNLKKSFKNKVVLKGLSMNVKRGEIVGLLGPNGAGKTTTFEIIMGFLPPDSGNIFLENKEITQLPTWKKAREGITYLPQEISIFKRLTVEENFEIVLEDFYRKKEQRKMIMEKCLKKLEIYHLKDKIAGNLSGGEKRRLEIARSLAFSPKFFLLDEPFSGIDPKTVSEIQDIILNLKNENIGILLTDHNVREALKITDRAYLIYEGEILIEGTPQQILNHPESRNIYFGEKFQL